MRFSIPGAPGYRAQERFVTELRLTDAASFRRLAAMDRFRRQVLTNEALYPVDPDSRRAPRRYDNFIPTIEMGQR